MGGVDPDSPLWKGRPPPPRKGLLLWDQNLGRSLEYCLSACLIMGESTFAVEHPAQGVGKLTCENMGLLVVGSDWPL